LVVLTSDCYNTTQEIVWYLLISIYKSTLYSYECLDSQIRQKYVGSKANEVWNGCTSRDNHRKKLGKFILGENI